MSKELVKDRVVEYLIQELAVPEEMIEIDTSQSQLRMKTVHFYHL